MVPSSSRISSSQYLSLHPVSWLPMGIYPCSFAHSASCRQPEGIVSKGSEKGLVMLLSLVDTVWPSLLCIPLFALTGVMTLNEAIIGFTTGTYDGNELINHYTTLNSNNNLARFIPALDAIDRLPHTGNDGDSNNSTAGLDGFIQAVQGNTDPLFRQAQLDKLDQLYWNPAVKLQSSIGAKNPLTQAFLYDMTVNHGQSGAQNFISKATYALGGTPGTGIDENTYLKKLMELRETYLKNTGNPGADRVAAFRRILDTGNVRLLTPFNFTVYGDTFKIDGNIQ